MEVSNWLSDLRLRSIGGHWSRAIYVLALAAVSRLPVNVYRFGFDMIAYLGVVTHRLFHFVPIEAVEALSISPKPAYQTRHPSASHIHHARLITVFPDNGQREGLHLLLVPVVSCPLISFGSRRRKMSRFRNRERSIFNEKRSATLGVVAPASFSSQKNEVA